MNNSFLLPLYYKGGGPYVAETLTQIIDIDTGEQRVYGLYRNPAWLGDPTQPRRKRFRGTQVIRRAAMRGGPSEHIEVIP